MPSVGDAVDDMSHNLNMTNIEPVFVIEPDEHYYIIKNKPITVTCKALYAVQVTFSCAGQWIRAKHQINTEIVDPQSQVRSLQSSINIDKEEVETYEGQDGYGCECHAFNSPPDLGQPPKTAVSRRGLIQVSCESFIFLHESVFFDDCIIWYHAMI